MINIGERQVIRLFKMLSTPDGALIKIEPGDKLYVNRVDDEDFPFAVCGVFDYQETILEYFETVDDAKNFIIEIENELNPQNKLF